MVKREATRETLFESLRIHRGVHRVSRRCGRGGRDDDGRSVRNISTGRTEPAGQRPECCGTSVYPLRCDELFTNAPVRLRSGRDRPADFFQQQTVERTGTSSDVTPRCWRRSSSECARDIIYFSTNFRRFKMELPEQPESRVREITRQTLPPEYRNKRIHRCWKIRSAAADE